jgi:hypothetical protein
MAVFSTFPSNLVLGILHLSNSLLGSSTFFCRFVCQSLRSFCSLFCLSSSALRYFIHFIFPREENQYGFAVSPICHVIFSVLPSFPFDSPFLFLFWVYPTNTQMGRQRSSRDEDKTRKLERAAQKYQRGPVCCCYGWCCCLLTGQKARKVRLGWFGWHLQAIRGESRMSWKVREVRRRDCPGHPPFHCARP